MASVGLNTICCFSIWTVSFLKAPCSCCKRERPHYSLAKYQREEASAGSNTVPLFSGCVGGWFRGRLVLIRYLCGFGMKEDWG